MDRLARLAIPCLFAFLLLIHLLLPDISLSQDASPLRETVPIPDLGRLSKGKEPIQITADQFQYDQQKDIYTADGHVVVIQGRVRLTGERVVLENATGLLTATGQVELFDGEDFLRAERLEMNVNSSRGVIYKGRIDTQKENYHIEGDRMERLSEDVYVIENGSFTTCDICPSHAPAWRFRAKRLKLRLDDYAVARGAAFYLKDIPVLYFPYLVFPVKTTRQSGFLLPRIGYSTQEEGFKYLQPFYWAIGRSHDATISFDYRSAKGMGGILEYRYVLGRDDQGRIETLYFYDRDAKQEQIDLRLRHNQRFTERLDLKADVNILNRKDVLRDLSTMTQERTQSSAESNFFVHYRGDLYSLSFLTRYTQNLIGSNNTELQRLPEINYSLSELPVGRLPLLFGTSFSAVNFWREDEVEDPANPFNARLRVFRADLFPKLWWPLDLGGLATLTPYSGLRETYYSRRAVNRKGFHREVPFGGVELKTVLVRDYGGRFLHFIEPAVQYEYADVLQDEVAPQFDQIDLASDKNLVTYSLTNRLRRARPPSFGLADEMFMLRLTQSYNLDLDDQRLSDLRAELQMRPWSRVFVDLDAFFNTDDRRFSSINTDAVVSGSPFFQVMVGQRYTRQGTQPKKGDLFNPLSLGERFNQPEKIDFLTVGASLYIPWPLKERGGGTGFYLATKGYYHLETDAFAEMDYGVKYSAQCWEIVVDYLDFPEKNQINFIITLKGAVTVDSRAAGGLFESKPPSTP